MREHPIPQDITGYKFHIIGNMTLKQFAELGAGALGGLMIYSTNLLAPIKWTLISISIGLGAAAAFLPIEERPLDHWILTFIRRMYRPTKFFWQKAQKIPEAFLFQPSNPKQHEEVFIDLTPARRQRIHEYLASVQISDVALDPFSQLEQAQLQEIMLAFQTVQPKEVSPKQLIQKPDLTVKVRSLSRSNRETELDQSTTVFDQRDRVQVLTKHQKTVEEVALNIAIPKSLTPTVEQQPVADVNNNTQQTGVYVESADAPLVEAAIEDEQTAVFNASLPFPSKPTVPNKLVGMILTPNNELIPEAIVEVCDDNNRVVRAVKSNALGQFFITTPLHSGNYTLTVEHDKFSFPAISISLNDETVDPVEIRSLG